MRRSRDPFHPVSVTGFVIGLKFIGLMMAVLPLSALCGAAEGQEALPGGEKMVRLTILFDNVKYDPKLKTGWGFSCLVEGLEKTILFDTGANGKILLSNMAKIGFDPARLDIVVLSHVHQDHTGGLGALLEKKGNLEIFLPSSFPDNMKNSLVKRGAKVVAVDEPCKICEGAFSTGEVGTSIKEQSLALVTSDGCVVITGCAHPGPLAMARAAEKATGLRVSAVIGGFHMSWASVEKIESLIQEFKSLGIKRVSPCHCSGNLARKMMREAFGEGFLEGGVGFKIELKRSPGGE